MVGTRRRCVSLFARCRSLVYQRTTKLVGLPHTRTLTSLRQLNFPAIGDRSCGCASITRTFTPSCKIGVGHLSVPIGPCSIFHYSIPGLDASLCFIIGSAFCSGVLPGTRLPRNICTKKVHAFVRGCPRITSHCCNGTTPANGSNVITLGAVLTRSNFIICIPRNIMIRHPVRLIGVFHDSMSAVTGHHVLIVVRPHSRTGLLIYSRDVSSIGFLTARIIRVFTNRNTFFSCCSLRRDDVSAAHFTSIRIGRRTKDGILIGNVALGGNLAHGGCCVRLGNRRTRTALYNVSVLSGRRRLSACDRVARTMPCYADGRLFGGILSSRTINTFDNHVLIGRSTRGATTCRAGHGLYTAHRTHVCDGPRLRVCTSSIGYSRNVAAKRLSRATLFCVRDHNVPHSRTHVLLDMTFATSIVSCMHLSTLGSHLRGLMRGHFHKRLTEYTNYQVYGWRWRVRLARVTV